MSRTGHGPVDSESKFAELVASSGNAFHSRVASWLKSNGWEVLVSPYYIDASQGKAREIDIIAEKICHTRSSHRHSKVVVVIRLFIECKFVAAPSVFWFADRDQSQAEQLVCSSGPYRMDNTRTSEHHYLSSPKNVAKVFASSSAKEPDNEPFYKALNQVLSAKFALRGLDQFVKGLPERERSRKVTLEFPVVVLNSFDAIRRVQFYDETDLHPITENFQLEARYAYGRSDGSSLSEYLLVDFVSYENLEAFCRALNVDAEVASHLIT